MASPFSTIPIRANSDDIFASWWNDIRTALINTFGSGGVLETQFTIADNQSAYTNVTGLLLDQAVTRSVDIEYTIYRTDGAVERRERGTIYATYKAVGAVWAYSRKTHHGDDALNVADSLFVTTAGQVQYKSDSLGGTYSGKMRYKIVMSFDKET